MITIVIADDHPLYLEGLEMLLKKDVNFQILKVCKSGNETINTLQEADCDVLLMDLHMLDMTGLDALIKIREFKPNQKIIILTHQKGNRYLPKLEKLNVNGYILKNIELNELITAITKVNAGEKYFSKGINQLTKEEDFYIKSSIILNDDSPGALLTEREVEILIHVCNELSSAEIGEKLFISVGTVDTHRKNIMHKLGVTSTVGLVKYALKHKLLEE